MEYSTTIIWIALIVKYIAITYLIYQIFSYIRCGCGKYAPFISSMGKIKKDIINEARTILQSSNTQLKISDLGCGRGALLIPLAKEFPQHSFVGYEWDLVPYLLGLAKIKILNLKNITFIKGDYMKINHHNEDLILCYTLKILSEPLGKKLSQEIKTSSTVISEMFPLKYLYETKQIHSSLMGVPATIFIYQKKQ